MIRRYNIEEASALLSGQTMSMMASQSQDNPGVTVWIPPENTCIISIHNVGADNAYVMARSITAGDDLAKDGVYFPKQSNTNYFDVVAGDIIYGKFSHFCSVKTGEPGVSYYRLTLMGVK